MTAGNGHFRNRVKKFFLMIILIMSAAMLTACGGASTQTEKTGTESSGAEKTESEKSEAAESGSEKSEEEKTGAESSEAESSEAENSGIAGSETAKPAKETAEAVRDLFMNPVFRVYTSPDMLGMELAGSVKNVMAVGSGIIDGMGFGDNTRAAMMTRGIAEMTRLGMAMGAKFETFAGLSGVGDMIVTCTSMHSRNFRCGRLIGQGMDPEEARKSIGMVVEGMFTAEAAYELSKKAGVEMPITEAIYNVIQGNIKVEDALEALMGRPRKDEYKK